MIVITLHHRLRSYLLLVLCLFLAGQAGAGDAGADSEQAASVDSTRRDFAVLIGGLAGDTMTGGAGADVFRFLDGDMRAGRANADVITDFSQTEGDRISLNLVDADTTVAGDQRFDWIGTDAFSGTAGELRYVQEGGSTYLEGDVNGDGVLDFTIVLNGLIDLTSADIAL